MGFFQSISGVIHIKITSADIAGLLTTLTKENIMISDLKSLNEMTVYGCVQRSDYNKIIHIIQRRGDGLSLINQEGIYWKLKHIARRPIFLSGMMLLLLISILLPSRILFIKVEGNHNVPEKMILNTANECGITMFSSRRKVRSEKVKNALLEKIPQLQWVGVNTAGCVATVRVTEKSVSDTPQEHPGYISSIIASRDGIIWKSTVLRGNPLFQVGQAVKAGQTLVSGYTDCGITIRATGAEAEIFAKTIRDLEIISPVIREKRVQQINNKKKISIILGKKLIKLYKGSGISDTTCVKIYDEIQLTLPGGFRLPITLICETITEYRFSDETPLREFAWLESAALDYLYMQMIAGQILDQDIQTEVLKDVYYLNGQFSCIEMIGQVKDEESIPR